VALEISRVTELAMSMILTSFGMHRGLRWNQVKGQFAEWRQRARSRNELQFLSDQTLRDVDVSRCDVHREVTKPFWMA
jgi:uncharacterized protein YjiS (DUF1127 family)